ncbi:hypothetical protein Dsin_011964 [Dipteronia sinensis]|uniref:Uncharacterized protein n=1 Tax=Dipteronia sinensis TaxID=43782 RepID=A0AAE0AIF6_9ROSI|nr:hypothetical protein Dsin_011964 [Dipteronia sinensis]
MSVEASGGGASVGSIDRSGGSSVGDEWSIGIDQIEESSDQRFSEEEKKIEESSDQRFNEEEKKIEESSDQGFSEEEKRLFVSFEKDAKVVIDNTDPPADAKPKIQQEWI